MGGFFYCVLGTSKDVTLGPTAIMSLLCSFFIEGDPVYAVLLTFLCGVIQASMALLKLGKKETKKSVVSFILVVLFLSDLKYFISVHFSLFFLGRLHMDIQHNDLCKKK